ncbi:MAG: AI-2E family transporter [Halobellus sp.]|uniref:AI-2E family transporter n=1 Tax=Halobellus sp. TaxID=1979212 RepID=UPI0035D51A93
MSASELNRSRASWWAVGLALGLALAYIVYSFIGTFVFGIFIYYATRPIYRRIKQRVRPPSLAAAVALFVLALPALGLVAYTGAVAVSELLRLTNQGIFDLSRYPITEGQLTQLTDIETVLQFDPGTLTVGQIEQVVSSLASAGNVLAFVGVGLVHLFAMIAFAFYLLRDDRRLTKWVRRKVGDDRGVLEAFMRGVDQDFTSIFFGNILNAVLTGTIAVVSYSTLNVFAPPGIAIPAAALVGLLAGVASLIPIVGMKLVYVPVAAYLGAVTYLSDPSMLWFTAVFIAVSFVVVDTIPDLVLRPFVSGRTLHVGAVMIAYTLGPLLFGWYGIFLGPIILVLLANFSQHVLSILIDREPLVPYAVDPGVATSQETGRSPPGGPAVATDGSSEADAESRAASSGKSGLATGPENGSKPSELASEEEHAHRSQVGGFEFGEHVADRE